ncbi:MAG TPA: PadR family transcriptional regulator [Mycobacterium sp.]|jgi:DNA-binding PadR family transcriptional regulator|uniref:PadR family transcriptional regulator n=1 Tax=Mycobacterium sp. TaxID=1785 RepID=UPI002D6DE82B|nr:PadR family transcriptional regulator [Mycobacterium sp.]HZU47875.1 PadR family transcriptional regulator [Mycobacterium sp.]
MSYPFSTPGQPFPGQPGFGFGPEQRRAFHESTRQARQEFREQVRAQAGQREFPFGFTAGFGPGFGPTFGPGIGLRVWRRGGRGRGRRGDVRTAILLLLAEQPMHGYEMIQQIAERSNGLWRPSPGSVYPTLQLLVDEGLIVATESDGSKKLFELTDVGRAAAEKLETAPWEEIADGIEPFQLDLQSAFAQLAAAIAQSTAIATAEQQARIADVVNTARREIYSILGESE